MGKLDRDTEGYFLDPELRRGQERYRRRMLLDKEWPEESQPKQPPIVEPPGWLDVAMALTKEQRIQAEEVNRLRYTVSLLLKKESY